MKLRASSSSEIFAGRDGLTDTQLKRMKELSERHVNWLTETDDKAKKKLELTDKMRSELKELLDANEKLERGEIELSQGAKTHIRKLVREEILNYKKPQLEIKEVQKGKIGEEEGIDLYNNKFFKSYVKSESKLVSKCGRLQGHPDIEDENEQLILDCKLPWSKVQHPITQEEIDEYVKKGGYDWQVKSYLYMKGWRVGYVFCALVDTPEELIPPYEDFDIHIMDDVPEELLVTRSSAITLTDEDIAHMERRLDAAEKYYNKYKQSIISCIN